jgi:hypothetical protein
MFKIDWKELAEIISNKFRQISKDNLVLKLKADLYLLYVTQGNDVDVAWEKAESTAKYFESKIK